MDLSRTMIRAMVRDGMVRAERYGMTWESNIIAFVVLMFKSAPNFDDHPSVRRILASNETDPNLRIELLWEGTSDEVWDAVSAGYEAGCWVLSET